jgi:hypothetical protein
VAPSSASPSTVGYYHHWLVEVAGDLVPGGDLDQRWLSRRTLRHSEGAAGMEVAARGGMEGAGHLAHEDHLLFRLVGVRREGGGKQGLRVWV